MNKLLMLKLTAAKSPKESVVDSTTQSQQVSLVTGASATLSDAKAKLEALKATTDA
jgi:hypothetical protein